MTQAHELHDRAMDLADQALMARRQGLSEQAMIVMRQALEQEKKAIEGFLASAVVSEPTRSILYKSAATLAQDCGEHEAARQFIALGLAGNPPAAIREELNELSRMILGNDAQNKDVEPLQDVATALLVAADSARTSSKTKSSATPIFYDDFTDPKLSRFYEFQPGVGSIVRKRDGLHLRIEHGLDGPPSAGDYLTIDSLGRPQPPTTQARLRFDSARWTVDVSVEYDFETKSNGRAAYVWIAFGPPSARRERCVAFVRSADLQPESHRLSVTIWSAPEEPVARVLSDQPGRRHRFRVTREDRQFKAEWSEDELAFNTVHEWSDPSAPEMQTLLFNSSSFAGGASFVIRSIQIFGAAPIEAPQSGTPYSVHGYELAPTEVASQEITAALRAGRKVHLTKCVVNTPLDLASVGPTLVSDITAIQCDFPFGIVASAPLAAEGFVSFLGCRFASIGFSNIRFARPFQAVACQFTGDARFIETHFDSGADFSISTFTHKPFFRIATARRSLSMYHSDFLKGADFSGVRIGEDLSISDIQLASGTLTFSKSEIGGTARLMVTLQRDAQEFGGAIDFSDSRLGALVISAGDRNNTSEYTGPPRWDLTADVFLRASQIGALTLHNVNLLGTLDLTGCRESIGAVEKRTAQIAKLVGAWPVNKNYYSCFISYSSKDQDFAALLRERLIENGVECWYAPKDLTTGDFFRQNIEDAIHGHDKLLLILSKESVESTWVHNEVEACFERETREKSKVLFPIRLDDAVINTTQAWAASIRRLRHIGDFRAWAEPDKYAAAFNVLLEHLKVREK